MEKYFSSSHMPQEFVTEAFAERCTFDEAGNIGKDKVIERAQIRLESCESVTADFCVCIGQDIQKARFSGIRQADKASVCHEFELDRKVAFLAVITVRRFHWSSIGRTFKIFIAETTGATLQNAHIFSF